MRWIHYVMSKKTITSKKVFNKLICFKYLIYMILITFAEVFENLLVKKH